MADAPADLPPLGVGDVVETAMLGPLIGGVVPLWIGGQRVLWQVDEPDAVRSVLGLGRLARTGRERDRYREVAMVGRASGTVMLLPRMRADAVDDRSVSVGARTFDADLRPITDVPPATDEAWAEFARWLTAVYVSAARRREFVVVELGGWEFRDEPFALAFAATDGDPPTNHLECSPRPDGASFWPPGADPRGQTISAPIAPGAIEATGTLLADAVRTWATSPLDIAVTFGTSSQSPLDV
jgi:hypothetical protein